MEKEAEGKYEERKPVPIDWYLHARKIPPSIPRREKNSPVRPRTTPRTAKKPTKQTTAPSKRTEGVIRALHARGARSSYRFSNTRSHAPVPHPSPARLFRHWRFRIFDMQFVSLISWQGPLYPFFRLHRTRSRPKREKTAHDRRRSCGEMRNTSTRHYNISY